MYLAIYGFGGPYSRTGKNFDDGKGHPWGGTGQYNSMRTTSAHKA